MIMRWGNNQPNSVLGVKPNKSIDWTLDGLPVPSRALSWSSRCRKALSQHRRDRLCCIRLSVLIEVAGFGEFGAD
jgi:hypothetical protein